MRGLSVLVLVLVTGCEARLSLGTACVRTTDCASPYVCLIGRCRTECVGQRDCPEGTLCRFDTEDRGNVKLVTCEVPLSEMFGYTTALRGMSQGRASNTMEFLAYRQMPTSLMKAVIEGD